MKAVKMAAKKLPTAPLAHMKLMVCLETSTLIARKAWAEPMMPLTKPREMLPSHREGIKITKNWVDLDIFFIVVENNQIYIFVSVMLMYICRSNAVEFLRCS